MTESIDAARLTLMLNDLRLPAIKPDWPDFAERANKEGWPAARFLAKLAKLAEHEIAERDRRRLARHHAEAQLLPGKTLDSFDFDVVPMISKAHVMAICAGDSWIDKAANLILIGGPGGGKTHLASAIDLALVEKGWRVLIARTSDLVQRLQVARRELALEAAVNRLDRFDLLILDDLAYVTKDQAESKRKPLDTFVGVAAGRNLSAWNVRRRLRLEISRTSTRTRLFRALVRNRSSFGFVRNGIAGGALRIGCGLSGRRCSRAR